MSPDRLQRLTEAERWHFWFVARRALLERLLGEYLGAKEQLVLDLGCGSRVILEFPNRNGYRLIGLDMRMEGLRSAKTETVIPRLMQADAMYLPQMRDAFDATISIDVIEGSNDKVVLAEIGRILRPGGLANHDCTGHVLVVELPRRSGWSSPSIQKARNLESCGGCGPTTDWSQSTKHSRTLLAG